MIESEADIERGLAALRLLDPRLGPAIEATGRVPLRRAKRGLPGLVATILAQQVSTASAKAILQRLGARLDLSDARALAAASDETFREAGLSRPKQRTLRAIAEAVTTGRLDLERIAVAPVEDAVAEMVAVHGIGTWTAECHLLFACGREDVFPAGDLALRIAAAHALSLPERPSERALREIAEGWSPHRSVAARLLFSHYHAITARPAEPSISSGGGKAAPGANAAARNGFTKATR